MFLAIDTSYFTEQFQYDVIHASPSQKQKNCCALQDNGQQAQSTAYIKPQTNREIKTKQQQ